MPLEPSPSQFPRRAPDLLTPFSSSSIRLAAGAGAALVVVTSAGHPLVLAVLLGVTAWSSVAGLAAVLAGLGASLRWASSSFAAFSGAQAVLGAGLVVGPPMAAAGAAIGAGALVLASPGGVASLPFGLAAALVVAGPAAVTPGSAAVRAVGALVCVGLAWASGRFLARGVAGPLGVVLGVVAVALQVAA